MKGRKPKPEGTRRRRNKTPGSTEIAGEKKKRSSGDRARRRPPLPPYETVMGPGVLVAVGDALAELGERVARVTAAAAGIADAAVAGATVAEGSGEIAWSLVDSWAKEIGRLVEGGKPDWHPQTVAWWAEVWHSPMAEHWLEVDRYALNRLAVMVEMYTRGPDKALLAEIRLQEGRFGLTPADRQRVGWKSPTKPAPKPREAPAAPPARSEDPRAAMRVVK